MMSAKGVVEKMQEITAEDIVERCIVEINEIRELLKLSRDGKITHTEVRARMARYDQTSKQMSKRLKELSKKVEK